MFCNISLFILKYKIPISQILIKSQKNLIIHNKPLEGKLYREAISNSKINLCFLRKANDDLQTDRTMEIPACKGFMIAERTNEQIKLFKEDIEAVIGNIK